MDPPVVEALWFTTKDQGFAGMSTGLFATGGGGRTWDRRLGGVSIARLMFVDPGHGWAVAKDRLFRTDDGGRSWHPLNEPPDPIYEVQFVDTHRGWAVSGSQALAITDDGGLHWSIQRPAGDTEAFCFANRTHGWVVGHNNRIETTADGGRHWAPAYHLRSAVEPDLRAVAHCREDTVWVLFTGNGAASKQNYTLVVDKAGQWEILAHNWGFAPEPTLADAPRAQAFGDYSGPFTLLAPDLAVLTGMSMARDEVWIVTAHPHQPWSSHAIPLLDGSAGSIPADPVFVDATHGWIAANHYERGAIIVATDDGGATWTAVASPTA